MAVILLRGTLNQEVLTLCAAEPKHFLHFERVEGKGGQVTGVVFSFENLWGFALVFIRDLSLLQILLLP